MISEDQLSTNQLSTEVSPDQLSTDPLSLDEYVKALQGEICSAHSAHCNKEGKSSLCNAEMVYHFYSDGETSTQKGNGLYGRRTEHIDGWNFGIPNIPKIVLPLTRGEHTYAILTSSECTIFRQKMEALAPQNL